MTTAQPMMRNSLPADTHVGLVSLTIADLDRSVRFYRDTLGFDLLDRSDGIAVLGSATAPLVELFERRGAQPKPPGATGLYHFAVLLPTRRDLGRTVRHLLDIDYPLDGAADHLVSEAIYLTDPDGNGIELYRDRPRAEWSIEHGVVRMASEPFDFAGVLHEADGAPAWDGIAAGARMGHIHLQVSDVERAQRFYGDLLGFDLMAVLPGARFLAAGGYHHHLGLNSWRSRGGLPAPTGSAGLRFFTVHVPEAAVRHAIAGRLESAGATVTRDGGSVATVDPSGNHILLRD